MKKTVAVFARSEKYRDGISEFLKAITSSSELSKYKFFVALNEGEEISGLDSVDSVQFFPVSVKTDDLNVLKDLSALQNLDLVFCFSEEEQRAAANYKATLRRPFYVVRNHLEKIVLPQDKDTRRLYNKDTDINCYFYKEVMEYYSRRFEDDTLFLNNPFLLEQESLGENSLALMLEHMLLAIFEASRNHPVQGKQQNTSHIKLSYVTHFYCNQEGIASVTDLLETYASYSKEVLDHIQFVIVDDGSPIDYEIPDLPLNLTWLKINKDIPWNQAGARNLGVLYSKSNAVLVTDLDHEFPEETFAALIKRRPIGKKIYKFRRKHHETGAIYKGHPNIFLLSRATYFEYFGYDEEFAGGYGAEDYRFIKFQKAQGTNHYHLPKKYFCVDRVAIDRDKQYHSLIRDMSINTPIDARKKMEMYYYGHDAGHSRTNFDYTWIKLLDRWREYQAEPKIDTAWKARWLLRQILPKGW